MSQNSMKFYQQWRKATDQNRNLLNNRQESAFFTPKEGRNVIRLISWERDPDTLPEHLKAAFTLRGEDGNPIPGDDGQPLIFVSSFVPIAVHYNIGTEKPFTCGRTFGESCAVCKRGSDLWRQYSEKIEGKNEEEQKAFAADKEMAKRHFASQRFFTFVLVFPQDTKKPDLEVAKLKPFIFGKKVWEAISEQMLMTDPEDEEIFLYGDITDNAEGRILYFNRKGRGRMGTSYDGFQVGKKIFPIDPTQFDVPDFYDYICEEMPYDEDLGLNAIDELSKEEETSANSPQAATATDAPPDEEDEKPAEVRKPNRSRADLMRQQALQQEAMANELDETLE